ncbi:ABC-type sugar transport systems, permease components [Anaerolinea thermolimosa]|uniref:carbohydrate ABC transporter permease n=1 Tax=Anaerolinea thermolimosa TaxID=229919 RepID=UPI000A3E7C7A|nr:sugar ABC transporter permease [Anaerolinea thermolimosa]GAP05183.1 ABC-type sugar transport systems, permease components [Anaerolinea thermolimosa]
MTPPTRSPVFRLTLRQRETISGYLTILPWFVGFLVFTAGPMMASLYYSLTDWGLVDQPKFIGLMNYQKMLSDPLVWQSLWVTVKFTITSVPARLILALIVALLLVRPIKGTNLMRTIYFIPSVVGGVPVALLWMWMLNADYGIVNYFLKLLGINGPGWIADPKWALWSLVLMSCWNIGSPMVILVAGLQNIAPHLYEAAELDGANGWDKFRFVTIPMLSPTLFFLLVSSVIGAFQVFDAAYVMTSGGPLRATYFYLLYFYQTGFRYLNMGYASALVWLLFVLIIIMTALIFRSSSLWVFYESEVKK